MSSQWGSNSKVLENTENETLIHIPFQSPQWGSNSKDKFSYDTVNASNGVSVPSMVDVNSTVCYLRTDICTLGIGYHNLAVPAMGK